MKWLVCKEICLPGEAKFVSVTYRLFKLPKEASAEACEMIYEGDIRGCEDTFKFDHKYTFKVCPLYFKLIPFWVKPMQLLITFSNPLFDLNEKYQRFCPELVLEEVVYKC